MATPPASDNVRWPKKLNLGVLGIGRTGQRHALNILHHVPRTNLLCVCSPAEGDLEWADQYLKPYGVHIYATFEELIETPGLEAVVIASAISLHATHTLESLERGIHVLCEKLITTNTDELSTIIRECKSKPRLKLMIEFVKRFNEDYMYAREKALAGHIGTPMVTRSQGYERPGKSGSFIEYAKASDSIFVDSTNHDIDLTLS